MKRLGIVIILICVLLTACSSKISTEKYNKLLTEKADLVTQNSNLVTEKSNLQNEMAELTKKNETLEKQITEYEDSITNLESTVSEYNSERLEKVKDELASIYDFKVAEYSIDSKTDLLSIWFSFNLQDEDEISQTVSEELGRKISSLGLEEWFDYDQVIIDVWGTGYGRVVTMTYDVHSGKLSSSLLAED